MVAILILGEHDKGLDELTGYITELQQPPTKWPLTEIAEYIGENEKYCRRVLKITAKTTLSELKERNQ